MRRLFTLLALSISALTYGQFGTAEDFTVTDLDGNEHNLYQILESGKPVILDVSATWCPPCWQLHQTHALENLHQKYGPEGTDQAVVMFYEGDPNTTLDQLMGVGNTRGNWLEGTSYPFINEAPLTLSRTIYWPEGFPTVSLIRPSDKEIVADMWNYSYAQMDQAVGNLVPETTDVEEVNLATLIDIFPNPTTEYINVRLGDDVKANRVEVQNIRGQVLKGADIEGRTARIMVEDLNANTYFLTFYQGSEIVNVKKFLKR